jgi:hypothetical protein
METTTMKIPNEPSSADVCIQILFNATAIGFVILSVQAVQLANLGPAFYFLGLAMLTRFVATALAR